MNCYYFAILLIVCSLLSLPILYFAYKRFCAVFRNHQLVLSYILEGNIPESSCGLKYYAQGGIIIDGLAYFTADPMLRQRGRVFRKSDHFPFIVVFDPFSFQKKRTYALQDTRDSSPLIFSKSDGKKLIIAHEYKECQTVALSQSTGNIEWISPRNQPGESFFGYSYYSRENGNKILFMAAHNGLHALDGDTGKELWNIKRKCSGGVTPCVDQASGTVFYQCDREMLKINVSDGTILKSIAVDWPYVCICGNTILVNDSYGYFIVTYWYGRPQWDSAVRVYDENLTKVWEKTSLPVGKKATLSYAEGKIISGSGNPWSRKYFGTEWKYLAAYSVQSGTVEWRCDLSEYGYQSIMNVPYFNGYFYAETQEMKGYQSYLFRINASTGIIEDVLCYGRAISSCAPSIISYGNLYSGDVWNDEIVVTRIAQNSRAEWPGPFCDPQLNHNALSIEKGAENVPMTEIKH